MKDTPMEMTMKDKIAFALSTSPFNIKSNIKVLERLDIKYPNNNNKVKLKLADNYYLASSFEKSTKCYFFIFQRDQSKRNLMNLVLSSLRSNNFQLYFEYLKIHQKCNIKFFNNLIEILIKKTPEIKLSNVYCDLNTFKNKEPVYTSLNNRNSFEKSISRLSKTDIDKMNIDNNRSDMNDILNLQKPTTSSLKNNSEYGYGDIFHMSYNAILFYIDKNQINVALKLLMNLFKKNTIFETINFLIKQERSELLFFLSEKHLFFRKYYEELEMKINLKFFKVFELLVEQGSSSLQKLGESFKDRITKINRYNEI